MSTKIQLEKIANEAFSADAKKAPALLRRKADKMIPSWRWDEMNGKQHLDAFTVAKVMKADVLQTLFDATEKYTKTGKSVEDLIEDIKPILQKQGWWGADEITNPETGKKEKVQLGSEHRIRLIVETNANIARARGEFKQMISNSHRRPYVKYSQIDRSTKNHDHEHLDGKIFSIDDPYIQKRWPPSDFGCDCEVYPMSEKQVLKETGKNSIGDVVATIVDFPKN
jgi:SPP1 gp7 family putative phage head morphogenesis protein